MDLVNQRRLLTAMAASLALGTVGAVGWSLSAIPQASDNPVPVRTQPRDPSVASAVTAEVDTDDSVLQLPLREPLEDPKPAPPKPAPAPKVVRKPTPAPKPEPKLELTVLGTVIDPRQRLAIISDPNGDFDIKGVGELLNLSPPGVAVQSIEPDEVTLVYNNRSSTLTIDKKRKPPKALRGRRLRNQ